MNVPKPPTEYELANLRKYTIDTSKGLVINSSGKSVGTIASDGYYRVSISSAPRKQRGFRRCHIIWWAEHGVWPSMEIDHKDRNSLNDGIDNLREATRTLQATNRDFSLRRNLPVGVYLRPGMKTHPYVACYKGKYLGYYATPEEASERYRKEVN